MPLFSCFSMAHRSQCMQHLGLSATAAVKHWLSFTECNTLKPYLPEKKTAVVLKTLVLEHAWVPGLRIGSKGLTGPSFPRESVQTLFLDDSARRMQNLV